MLSRFSLVVSILLSVFGFSHASKPESCPLKVAGSDKIDFGLLVRDINTGQIVSDINSEETFVPASVTKALTVASVLSQLPPDQKFKTECVIEGIVRNDILEGNIIVNCSGDPTLESRYFPTFKGICDSIASHVKKSGISTINGAVLFEYPILLEEHVPGGWMSEDLVHPYGTAYHAVNFKDNRMVLNAATLSTNPPMRNFIVKRVNGSRIYKKHESDTLYVGNGARGSIEVALPTPQETFAAVLTDALTEMGIEVNNKKIAREGNQKVIYTHYSPPYKDIAKSLMFRSDNMMAEAMLRTLAPTRSRASALQREISLWDARGLDTKNIFVEDGSGLSRKNRLSPRFLSDVLLWMVKSDDGRLFTSFFPKAGLEGTMKGMLKGSILQGRLATKTGSMRGVQCFAGYLLDENGTPSHTVVVMVNGFKCDRGALKDAIGKYLITVFDNEQNDKQ